MLRNDLVNENEKILALLPLTKKNCEIMDHV